MKLVWRILYPIAIYWLLAAGVSLLFPDLTALASQGIAAAGAVMILGVIYVRGHPLRPGMDRSARGKGGTGRRIFPRAGEHSLRQTSPETDEASGAASSDALSDIPETAERDRNSRFFVPRSPMARVVQCVCIGAVSCILFNSLIAISGLEQVFTGYRENLTQIYTPPFWQQIALAGFLIPMAEELVFRGMIYEPLRERFSFAVSMVLSAVIFGLYHGTVVQGLYGFCMGLVLAESYEHRGGLPASLCVHAAANLTAVLATYM